MQQNKIYGIIGEPLGHSLSALLHNTTFQSLKHKGTFVLWPLAKENIAQFVQSVRLLKISGVCVTIPHKQEVLKYLDYISPLAKSVGAVNTLYWDDNALCGDNTDVSGFLQPLLTKKVPNRALVLGAGGAARAIIVALKTLRSQGMNKIFLSSRTKEKAQSLCDEFQCIFVPWEERANIKATWIINTTPLGMKGEFIEQSPYHTKMFKQNIVKDCLAYDIVYNPLQTRFLHEAQLSGWQIQDGLDMFIGQAIEQQKLWLNQANEHAKLRILLEEHLKK